MVDVVAEAGISSGSGDAGDTGEGSGARPLVRSRRAVLVVAVTALALVALDLVTKIVAVATLSDRPPVELIPGVLDLRLTRNSGAAFSLAGGATVLLSLIAMLVVVVVAVTARRLASTAWALVFGGMLAGAVGNLIDRIFRSPGPLRGHVVDFIHIHHWPVFNVADSSIVCAGVLAVVLAMRGIGLDGGRLSGSDEDGAAGDVTPGTPEKTRTPAEAAGPADQATRPGQDGPRAAGAARAGTEADSRGTEVDRP